MKAINKLNSNSNVNSNSNKSDQERSFSEYLIFLRESIHNLEEYWQKIGHDNPHIKDISAGLNHKDPFIIYKASIAATLLLEDRSIYH